MHQEPNIHQLIVRLLAGESNDEEKKIVAAWLDQDPQNGDLMNDLREIWLCAGIEQNPDHFDTEAAIRHFFERKGSLAKRIGQRRHLFHYLRYAAVFLLMAALPVSFYYGKKSIARADSVTTISCRQKDRMSVILPDSSRVYLNSESRITFNNNFGNGIRQVYLDGEAFFSIRKDSRNPFWVKTSDISIEVFGTDFNLKAYSDEKNITTTLVKGCLRVITCQNAIKIKPNQKLIYNKSTQSIKLKEVTDLSSITEWKEGKLVFCNQSLEELKHKLERWFNVQIEFADEQVKTRRFTGTLEHESILDFISYFGHSKYVAYKIKNNVITFYSKS